MINLEILPQKTFVISSICLIVLILSWIFIVYLKHTRKTTIRKLKEKGTLLNSVINQIPIVIFSFDDKGKITLIEGNALETFDPKQEFLIGKSMFGQVKTNKVFIEQLKDALIEGKEKEFKSEIAGKIWRINISPILDAGQVKSVVGVAVEVTEETKLEQAKTEFLSLTAHHLRTLPTGIKWTIELLSPKMEKLLEKDDLHYWRELERTNMRMMDLANNISRASQLELGKLYVFPEKFSLPKLIDEEIENLRILAESTELKILKNYNNVEEVEMGKSQVKVIIHTLLSNAFRYTSPGGLINIDLLLNGDMITIMIKDNGWGIPKQQQGEIFTKLFRADNVSKKDASGMGLGLFIAKAITEKLGGKIWFESEENKGSTFFVELPRKQVAENL